MRRGKTTYVICGYAHCNLPIKVRVSDLKRGWGKYCDKSCKASEQNRRVSMQLCVCGHERFDHAYKHCTACREHHEFKLDNLAHIERIAKEKKLI